MQTRFLKQLIVALLLVCGTGLGLAAEKKYKETTVWNVTMIRVEPGQTETYLESLRSYYTTVMKEAVKQKLIISYKVLSGESANPQDWDIMILTEWPNFAAFDTAEEKFDAIRARLMGSIAKADEADKKAMADRVKIRSIFGSKLLRQIEFAK